MCEDFKEWVCGAQGGRRSEDGSSETDGGGGDGIGISDPRWGRIHNIRSSGRSHPRRPLPQIGISHHTTPRCTQAAPNTRRPLPSPRALSPEPAPWPPAPARRSVMPSFRGTPSPRPPRSSSRCAHSARRRVAPEAVRPSTSPHANLPAGFVRPGRRGLHSKYTHARTAACASFL